MDKFTSTVLQDLHRLTNHATMSLQQEDGLRYQECVAVCALPPKQDYRVCKVVLDKELQARDKALRIDNRCSQVQEWEWKLFLRIFYVNQKFFLAKSGQHRFLLPQDLRAGQSVLWQMYFIYSEDGPVF